MGAASSRPHPVSFADIPPPLTGGGQGSRPPVALTLSASLTSLPRVRGRARKFFSAKKHLTDPKGFCYIGRAAVSGLFFVHGEDMPGTEKRAAAAVKDRPLMGDKLKGGCEMRTRITLSCTECKQRNYNTTKEKKNHPERMETKKYCPFCKRHTLHRESK